MPLVIALSACGGAGGGSAPRPLPTTTAPPSGNSAQGLLVDDPSGVALANVRVRLDPWIVYPTPGPTPTPLYTTTTDATGHFTIIAKNGTYLLVIGDDDPAFPSNRPTIHDKIVFTGEPALMAPTMPPIPGITPAPAELNGNYRLVTIDATRELPCIQDFDSQRAARGLVNPVVDEWLTENVRAVAEQHFTSFAGEVSPANPFGFLTSGNISVQGDTSCSSMEVNAFAFNAANYAARADWLAASYIAYPGSGTIPAYGAAEFPTDPRLSADPNAVEWP